MQPARARRFLIFPKSHLASASCRKLQITLDIVLSTSNV